MKIFFLKQILFDLKASDDKIISCVDFLSDTMPLVLSRIYVSNYFDSTSRKAVYENNHRYLHKPDQI